MVKVKTDITGWKMWEHGVPDSRLTVIQQAEDDYIYPDGRREAKWLCECSCDEYNHIIVRDSAVKYGGTKSCGCLCKERALQATFIDMTGWVMAEHGVPDSRLTVIKRAEDIVGSNGRKRIMWLCECNCSQRNQVVLEGSSVRFGSVKSCGCLLKESASQRCKEKKKYNKVDLSGEYGLMWSTNTNEEIYFDFEDAANIINHTWMVDTLGYPTTNINDKPQRMHVFLGYKWHDHHNRNKLDNRKQNLVLCTPQENARNSSIKSNNKSGIIGVYKSTQCDSWIAQIKLHNGTQHLGSYKKKEDAIRVRLRAEKEHFGDFAPQRHLFEKYGIEQTIQN